MLAARVYPRVGARKPLALAALALALGCAACGGGGHARETTTQPGARIVAGAGYSFVAPGTWVVKRVGGRTQAAPPGDAVVLVSVTTFRLLKPYRPALFAPVSRELDGVAARFARLLHGRVAASRTVSGAGGRVRQYDIAYGKGLVQRTTFVLRGRREFLLSCRRPAREPDPGGACSRLVSSFRLT